MFKQNRLFHQPQSRPHQPSKQKAKNTSLFLFCCKFNCIVRQSLVSHSIPLPFNNFTRTQRNPVHSRNTVAIAAEASKNRPFTDPASLFQFEHYRHSFLPEIFNYLNPRCSHVFPLFSSDSSYGQVSVNIESLSA